MNNWNENTRNGSDYLTNLEWPIGLQSLIFQSVSNSPLRYMILDDSGSMATNDGCRLTKKSNTLSSTTCSRWEELSYSVKFHATLAHILQVPTQIHFLNHSQSFSIGNGQQSQNSLNSLFSTLNKSPGGGTPLCRHIRNIVLDIQGQENRLRQNGQRAIVVIATDGESSDGDIIQALKPLESLPVWVVIKLCTNSDSIVSYWNNIDSELELEMDVLDDCFGEAKEVANQNPWLTYGEPLHRLREWGIQLRELDLIDESPLQSNQIQRVVNLMFPLDANTRNQLEEISWESFLSQLPDRIGGLTTWDPIEKSLAPWIKTNQLKLCYPNGVYAKSRVLQNTLQKYLYSAIVPVVFVLFLFILFGNSHRVDSIGSHTIRY